MKAADINKRRKLLLLLWRALRIRRERPSFITESGLIVCVVQTSESIWASARLPGVLVETPEPERAAIGVECASYQDKSFIRIEGWAWPRRVTHRLSVTRIEEGFSISGVRAVAGEETNIFSVVASYDEARSRAIRWIRGVLSDIGDFKSREFEQTEPTPITLNFTPALARKALRWLPDDERRTYIGDPESGKKN